MGRSGGCAWSRLATSDGGGSTAADEFQPSAFFALAGDMGQPHLCVFPARFMLLRQPKGRARRLGVVVAVLRDPEEQLSPAFIFEAALLDCLLDERRRLRPVFALDADLPETQVEAITMPTSRR